MFYWSRLPRAILMLLCKFVCDGLLRSASTLRFFSFPLLPWQRIKSMRDYDVFVVLTSRHYLYVCSCTARVISACGRENLAGKIDHHAEF